MYRGVQMRSRLEADFAAYLDREGHRWEYEPMCYASEDGQWLPDFACYGSSLIELKPAGLLSDIELGSQAYIERVDHLLTRMTIAWCTDPELALSLVFWTYGGPIDLMLYARSQGHPWEAQFAGQPMPLLWPGMGYGQHARVKALMSSIARPPAKPDVIRILRDSWQALVGPDLAAHTEPGSFNTADGELTVYADSTAWETQVRLLARELRDRINGELGPDAVTVVKARRGVAR